MKEDWLKDIHDKMSTYETDEPRNLWEDICRARQSEREQVPFYAKTMVRVWVRRGVAVAALVALVLAGTHRAIRRANTLLGPPAPQHLTTDAVDINNRPFSPHGLSEAYSTRTKLYSTESALPSKVLDNVPVMVSTSVITPVLPVHDDKPTNDNSSIDSKRVDSHPSPKRPVRPQRADRSPQPSAPNHRVPTTAWPDRRKTGRLTFSAYATGGPGSTLGRRSTGNVNVTSIGPDQSEWRDNPMLGIMVYNQGREIETKITHHLPVRTGVTFAYQLNHRLSLGSGLNYTRLVSDRREGSDSHYMNSRQILHYVGIPLQLKYDILAWKGLELYATAGVLTEKCVSGKSEKDFVLDDKTEQTQTEKLASKPFQCSVNAAAGLQYNLTNTVGLYAEPGVSYYFDDGSSVETIYKDKPLNFSLNIGFRITMGR